MPMRTTLFSILLLISVVSLTGCCSQPRVVEKIVYVNPEVPENPRPIAMEFNPFVVEFQGNEYLCVTKGDAAILSSNWESYKEWAERSETILNDLREKPKN